MSNGDQSGMRIRGLRGATRVARDDSECIRTATRQLLAEMLLRNSLRQDAIVSAFFTVTPDLVSEFPARAAREMGWDDVAMLCSTEIPVPGSMDRVVRVLLHAELPANSSLRHVYLNGAEELRPDL
ncbi:MAG TPA: chorismate mutase [Gemmatimonadaceae bacterium]|nr:chorismate mutase [Gemmatimonadaceae bacterium]